MIACFTGGSSALTSLPPAGVTPEEKRDLHRLLLGAGLPISEVNTVRKQVSGFKGGRLALAVAPARLINLTVSDVAGDPLDAITDPSVANDSTVADAVSILRSHDLWGEVAGSIRGHLEDPRLAVPDLSGMEIHTTLLVTGETACEAMAAEARAAGAEPGHHLDRARGGGGLGRPHPRSARARERRARPARSAAPSVLIGCGGESTVRLGPEHEFGTGGPNQEAALAAAGRFEGADVSAVFIDTDGSDGGTDLAGAISDGATCERAREAGIDIRDALARHRSGDAVAALGDGIETGPTHTNVNDLFAIAIGEAELMSTTDEGRADDQARAGLQEVRRGDRGRRRLDRDRSRRVLLDARAERLRQDDDAADDRRLRGADGGPGHARRRGRDPRLAHGIATSTWSSRTTRCSRT